jgi:hypothetical protein
MLKKTVIGIALASAVGTLLSASAFAAEKSEKDKSMASGVKCAGVNECKGHGSCGGADNSCKGQNSCKGKGWTEAASAKACTDKGGTVVAAK